MMLSTAQLDTLILALREFITRYSLPGYEQYTEEVQDANEALAALLATRGA